MLGCTGLVGVNCWEVRSGGDSAESEWITRWGSLVSLPADLLRTPLRLTGASLTVMPLSWGRLGVVAGLSGGPSCLGR